MALHPCSAKYAAAIADPFSDMALGSCVPIGTANTLKCMSRNVATLVVGTEGVGACVVYPSGYNNVGGAYVTTADYDAGNLTIQELPTAKWSWIPASRLPFDAGTYLNVNARVVSAGLRIRYIGALAERAGTIDLLTQPTHNQIGAENSGTIVYQNDITGYPENYHSAVTNQSFTLSCYGVDDEERNFPKVISVTGSFSKGLADSAGLANLYWYPLCSGDWASLSDAKYAPPASMVAYIRGTPGAKFDVEYIVHVEYVGRAATYGTTKVEADPVGVAKICEAANQAQVDANADGLSYQAAFGRAFKRIMVENGPRLAAKATNMLLNQLGNVMSGPSMSTALLM